MKKVERMKNIRVEFRVCVEKLRKIKLSSIGVKFWWVINVSFKKNCLIFEWWGRGGIGIFIRFGIVLERKISIIYRNF